MRLYKKGGPALGKQIDRVVDWQLEHPEGTAEECVAWLKEAHAADEAEQGGL